VPSVLFRFRWTNVDGGCRQWNASMSIWCLFELQYPPRTDTDSGMCSCVIHYYISVASVLVKRNLKYVNRLHFCNKIGQTIPNINYPGYERTFSNATVKHWLVNSKEFPPVIPEVSTGSTGTDEASYWVDKIRVAVSASCQEPCCPAHIMFFHCAACPQKSPFIWLCLVCIN